MFVLIGLQLHPERLWQQALPIVGVFGVILIARAVVVYCMGLLAGLWRRDFPPAWRHVVVWSWLRGAVPVALALCLAAAILERAMLTSLVFGVVFVSLLLQGLTMPALLRQLSLSGAAPGGADEPVALHASEREDAALVMAAAETTAGPSSITGRIGVGTSCGHPRGH